MRVTTSSPEARSMDMPLVYKMLRLKSVGAEIDKVIFKAPEFRWNQCALQLHNDLANGFLGAIGLNRDDVPLIPGPHPQNPNSSSWN